jgi:hypothetical protein
MRGPSRKEGTEILLSLQTIILSLLLVWLYFESRSNDYFRAWLSQNFPIGLILLNEWIVAGAISELLLVTFYWILQLEGEETRQRQKVKPVEKIPRAEEPLEQPVSPRGPSFSWQKPIYESIETRSIIILLLLCTQAISLWFITAASFRVTVFTANSFYYYSHLPFTYWWGLGATLALFFARPLLRNRAQTGLDITALFILAFYLIGLPSFTYQDPRFLDTYYHTGNSLDLLNYQGWPTSPNWYVHQFPGVFSYVSQLVSVAGIDPFQLMKFFPLGLAIVVAFLMYVTAKMYSPQYASIASAVLLGGLWFQLHISPQAGELILYAGAIFLFLKLISDEPRRRTWTFLALVSAPILVASHPETPLALGLGLVGFYVLLLMRSRRAFSEHASKLALPFMVLVLVVLFWWANVSIDARNLVQRSIVDRALQALFKAPLGTPVQTANVAATPSYSYGLSILSEQGVSVLVWAVGLSYFTIFRKLHPRELFLGGLFLAAVSTIPLAVFGRADVLQRSYLFALFPFVVLTAWLLERRTVLTLGGRNLFRVLQAGFIIMMIIFAVMIPITRYGVDPVEYIPGSSLYLSNIGASLDQQHSVLFLHPDEDGWRFYAGLNGAIREPKVEQLDLSHQLGGFVKPGSDATIPGFNLTYTPSDNSANYIILSSYWQNLYTLRFGSNSGSYIQARNNFTAMVTQNFNIVYSTGTDQLYESQELG